SKIYARGAYDPISYVIQWVYKGTQESSISDRYKMDSMLNLNIVKSSFYPYTVSNASNTPYITSITYLNYPNSVEAPEPGFKYLAFCPGEFISFADEHDASYSDWSSFASQDYLSFFTTVYSLQGKGIFKWQPTYLYIYARNSEPYSYAIAGVWDYSVNKNSGKISSRQIVTNNLGQPNFGMLYRRHKIRGHGMVYQFTLAS